MNSTSYQETLIKPSISGAPVSFSPSPEADHCHTILVCADVQAHWKSPHTVFDYVLMEESDSISQEAPERCMSNPTSPGDHHEVQQVEEIVLA